MIDRYYSRGIEIKLFDSNSLQRGANVFSILVGKNGSGKSTLLGKLTSDVITESKHGRRYYSEREELPFDFFPREIISVSTSPFDKFPIDRSDRMDHYTYLGLRDLNSSNFGIAYLSKIIASLIESVSKENRQANEIGRVLDYLGYRDDILMQFQVTQSSRLLKDIVSADDPFEIFESRHNIPFSRKLNKSFFFNQDESISKRKIQKLKDITHKILNREFNVSNSEIVLSRYGLNINFEESEDILFLIQSGVVRLRDVKLQSIQDRSFFSIKDASSGEQSIILSILGIASKITDNCLICIDEPEICLHPQWQEKYIEILTSTFSHYQNCHFIIATHSPQIISKLSNINSFIVDMESGITKEANEFIYHSADYQLATVFDFPGYRNEYLSRIALNIFTKVSKKKIFDEEDLTNFRVIEKQSKYLDRQDPVYDLYITLKELLKIYG